MGYRVYINYTAEMEAHVGLYLAESINSRPLEAEFVRAQRPGDTKVLAFVDAFSSAAEMPDAAVLSQIIDEAFIHIGHPTRATAYSVPTALGVFGFMWRPGFPADAISAKHALQEVLHVMHPTGHRSGLYLGKPAKLYRYGKRLHLMEALNLGRFLVKPATSFKDMTGDTARQDDELRRVFEHDSSTMRVLFPNGQLRRPIGPIQRTSARLADYFMLCFSMEYSAAIANEFSGCDACLVINSPNEFAERLHAGFDRSFPGYHGFEAPVSYGVPSSFGVCFTKPARYESQVEYRFAWSGSPFAPPSKLKPEFITTGALMDLAEVVPLPT